MKSVLSKLSFCLLLLFVCFTTNAQDERAQIPKILKNSYFEVNIGSINYDFGQSSLEPGYNMQSVDVPHSAVRLVLFGYEFNKYLAAQITYMRPVKWVHYKYDGINSGSGSVWMNVGGLTLKPMLPLGNKFSVYGEAGLGIITRSGFKDKNDKVVITNAEYPTFLFGAGLRYHLNDNWRLQISSAYSPKKESQKQPATTFLAAGFSYKLVPLSKEKLDKAASLGYIHPKQFFQIGYSTNLVGYGVNNLMSNGKIPLFWGGDAEVRQGLTLSYQRNLFHGPKLFSLDIGASASFWQSKGVGPDKYSNPNKQNFFTFSVFPVVRFNFLHRETFDSYIYYSVAGPSFISKKWIDGEDMGGQFTFQDNMGIGTFFGKDRRMNIDFRLGHYSNGNVYPANDAVKIPLTILLGYAF